MTNKVFKKYDELIALAQRAYKTDEVESIRRAFEFSRLAHLDDKRLSGDEFILHPLETSINLVRWKLDPVTVVAGLLHDTIEHGAAKDNDILENFGSEVMLLVEGVTKVSAVQLKGKHDEEFVENLRKMFLAMAQDLRVVLIRFAERLDNLKTLQYLPEDRRVAYAKESLEIFAPLAERLDMWEVKTKLDELAFKYAYPNEYKEVKNLSDEMFKNAERNISKMKTTIESALKNSGVNANVYGRKKGLYSIFNKLNKPEVGGDITKVHDVVALRILVDEVKECYQALGIVHSFYKPIPNILISDFIAVPKPNGYRSIHTKVFGPEGKIAEVQIRTYEMHEQAEYGGAAHLAYGEAKKKGVSDEVLEGGKVQVRGRKLEWVRQLAEWQREIKDSGEFLKAVKFDALSHRIFVFSPQGDVYDLPENATPLDFAYAVHTNLGNFVKLAKVDGKIVPLNYKLRSAQVVEIEKSKFKRVPNNDWLDSVVTTIARREIKKELKRVGGPKVSE